MMRVSPFTSPVGVCRRVLFAVLMLLLTLPLPAMACRLVTVVQVRPGGVDLPARLVSESRSLLNQANTDQPFYQLAGQSLSVNALGSVVPNGDGAGMAAFSPTAGSQGQTFLAPLYFRQSTSLQQTHDGYRATVQALQPLATTLLAHVRARTSGTVAPENNHPFTLSLGDRPGDTWAFMANGGGDMSPTQYQRWVRDPRILARRKPWQEGTDTERLFHVMLQAGLSVLPTNGVLTNNRLPRFQIALREAYHRVMRLQHVSVSKPFAKQLGYRDAGGPPGFLTRSSKFARVQPNTVVMSNGAYTFIIVQGYQQWYQLMMDHQQTVQAIILASEPTNLKEYYLAGERFPQGMTRWQQLPENLLVTLVNDGQQLTMDWQPLNEQDSPPPARSARRGDRPAVASKRCTTGCD
jgi:predicted glutamine amidotransferase